MNTLRLHRANTLLADQHRRPTPRAYSIRIDRDLRGHGLDWRLSLKGDGHWCEGGFGGRYRSEADARRRGMLWVATGFPAPDQDRRAPMLADALDCIARAARRTPIALSSGERGRG